MLNIKLEIEYDGTDFCGWQIQNRSQAKKASIQEVLEKALHKILQEKVRVIGSGRTDAGVHALGQIANFKTESKIPLKNIQRALNSILPSSVSIKNITSVKNSFHSCDSAKSKTYRYIILNRKTPSAFRNKFSWHIPYELDLKLMRSDARALVGRHNFKSFCASGSGAKTTVRTIKRLLVRRSSGILTIDIEADGFLYNMVRNIVGTLVEIGRGKIKKGSLCKILKAKNRTLAGPTAPARGLFLVRVEY